MADSAQLPEIPTANELSQWRFRLITTDPMAQKLALLQEIFSSSLAMENKVYLLLDCFRDERLPVREGAFAALQCLGLSSRAFASLKQILQGDINVLASLREVIAALQPLDMVTLGIALLQLLESGKKFDERLVFEFLARLVERAILPASITQRLVRVLLDQPLPTIHQARICLSELLVALAKNTPDLVYPLLWEEVQLRDAGEKRRFILKTLRETGIKKEDEEKFYEYILGPELQNYLHNPQGVYYFEKELLPRASEVLALLLEVLLQPKCHYPVALVEMAERFLVGGDLSLEQSNQTFKALLKAIPDVGIPGMQRIIWSGLFRNHDLPVHLRKMFAHEIALMLLTHKSVNEFYEEMTGTLIRLGAPAIEAMAELLFAQKDFTKIREPAVRLIISMREIFHTLSVSELPQRSYLRDFCRQSLQKLQEIAVAKEISPSAHSFAGEWAELLGYLLSTRCHGDKKSLQLFLGFSLTHLWRFTGSGGLLRALSTLCFVPAIQANGKNEIINLFQGLLQRCWDTSSAGLEAKESEEMRLQLYWLPDVLQGTRHIFTHLSSKNVRRKPLLQCCLQKWHNVMSWREVWSPGNIELLLHTLGEMVNTKETTQTEKSFVVNSLLQYAENFAPTKILSIISPILPSKNKLSSAKFSSLLDRFFSSFNEEEEAASERYTVLSKLISHRVLPNSHIQQALQILIKGYHLQNEDAQTTVRSLVREANIPLSQRQLIKRQCKLET